ncbi:hypothetical protein [Candidatus Ventrimonas sp.]|uniref:hypothetical protein n=1 Tax=Candidatus Ventrimonas sp. TaxID=3048889 RepID=UPI003AB273FC
MTKMKSLAETAKKKRDNERQNYLEKKANDAKGVAEYGPFRDGTVHITPYEDIKKRADFQTGAYQGAKDDRNPIGTGNTMKGFWSNAADGTMNPFRIAARAVKQSNGLYNHSFQSMTDDQKTMYNYLYHRYGADQADRYASAIDDELNVKAGRQGAETVSKMGTVPAVGLNVLASTAAGSERAVKGLGQAVDMVTGNYETAPVSNFDGYLQHLQEKSSGAARIAYDLANSTGFMLPSMLVAPAAGAAMGAAAGSALGSAMFGAAAGGNSYADSIREGQDVETAQLYGALNAASETATQAFLGGLNNVSLGHPKVKSAIDTAVRKMISNPAVRDRMIQAAGYGADMAAEGLQEYTQELLDKASRNMLFGEKNKISLADPEAWYAAMLGALNAGVLNAPGAIAQELDYRSTGKNIVPEYSEFAEGINTDQSYAAAETQQETRDLQELAQRYAQQQENGESIPARDNGRFLERMENFTENVQQGEEITQNQEKDAQNTEKNAQNMTDDVQEEIVQKPEMNPQNVSTAPVETQLETGSIEDDTLGELSEQYGKYGKNAYVDYYDHETDLPQYSRTFDRVYDAGRWGIKMDEAVHQEALSTLGREKLENIWKAGAQDREMVTSNVNRETGEPLNMTQGEVRIGGLSQTAENASSAQKTFAQYMGTRTGLTFDLVDGMEQGGAVASYEKGKVTLDINSKDFLGSASHELTHFIRDYAPGEYNEYADTVIRQIMKSEGMDLQEGTESYINNYMSQAGQQLTREQAVEEIVADASQKFFNDEEFIKEVTQNRNLGQKILDFINDVIDAIRSLIKTGSTRQSAKALEENLVYFQRARRDYMAGLETASERYKAGYEIEGNEGERFKLIGKDENGIETYETSENVKNLSIKERKNIMLNSLLEEFHGRTAKFEHEGKVDYAVLDEAGIRKGIYGDKKSQNAGYKTKINIGADKNYFELLENSKYYRSSLEQGKTTASGVHDNTLSWDYYLKTIKADGKFYDVLINVRNTGKDQFVYDVSLKGKKTEPPSSTRSTLGQGDSVSTTVQDRGAIVKKKFQLKDPVEETGTLIAAVAPEGTDESVMTALADRGIKTVSYDPEVEGSRNRAVNSVEGIRFQMEDMDDYLFYDNHYVKNIIKENQELKEANELLKKEFTLTAKDELRQDDIRKACGKVLKEYNSKAKLETVASNVTKLFEYVRSGDRIAWDEASEVATVIGRSILEQAQQKDTALTEQYKDLRKQIKDTKILITDQDKADLAAAGGYNSFRQKYFGRMSLGKTGISVDTLYQELSSQHPDLFDPDITHPADQLMQIGNVLDITQPQVLNPYHANMDEMAYHVGQELLQEYWNVRQPAPTFADRKAEELRKVRQQYNNKLDAYKQKMGDQYTALLNETRRENADMRKAHARELYWQKEKFNTKMKDRREALAKREAKESVIKESARLRKWLLEPNDKQHIPEELRTVVADFLSNIDFSSKTDYNGAKTQRTMAWEEALKAFNTIKETGQITDQDGNVRYVDIDPDQVARMEELNKKVKGIDRLEDLDSYSLQELLKTVRSMKSTITEINTLKTNKKYGEVSLLAESVFHDTDYMKDRKEFRGPVGQVDSLLNIKMMDPVTVFHKIGPAMETVYDSLTTGWDKKTKLLKEASDYFSEALKECGLKPKDIRGWTGKNPERHSFSLSGGDITLSTGQIMALYELDKRGQARKHIYDQKGGIKAGEIDLGTSLKEKRLLPERLRGNKPIRVTAEDVKTITAVLTDYQKKLADKMQRFLGDNAANWGNEASREMYGYDKYKSRNYFPITTDKDYIMQPEGNKKDSTIRNLGMTKSTNAYANNPIIVEDIFDVFTRHVDQMSSYNGLLVPLSDLHKLLNYKDARGFNGSSIQERIKATLGTGTAKYLDNLVDDINGSVHTRNDTGIADMLMGNMKAAAVAGNLRVAVQQPGSIARAYAELDAKYIAKGLIKGANWDIITEYAPIAQWKDWGFYQMQVSRRMKDILVETDSAKDRFVNKTMVLAELGDQVTWKRLWNAVEYETMDRHPNLQKGSKEYYTEVGHRFSEIIYKTQVADSVMLRTEVMRSKDALAKMATAFMGEPLKTYNMLYRAVWDLKAGRLDKKTARNNAMRVAAAFTANAFLTAAAAAAVDMFRDDDREKDLGEKFQSHMAANMIDNVNILNSVPYIRDVISTVQGNTVKRTDMQGIQDVYYAWKKVYKAMQKTGKYTPQYAFLEALRSTSALTGIPIKSITRDALSIIDTTVSSLSGAGEYEATKMKYGLSLKDNKSLYVSMMMNATEARDKALADKIKRDLMDAGYTEDDIEKQMNQEVNKEIKDNIDIISAADKYDYQDKESRDAFEEEICTYIELKKKAGKTEKDALSSVKTKLAAHYTEMYQKGDQKTKKEVIEKCNRFRYKGKAVFNGTEYKNWAKK